MAAGVSGQFRPLVVAGVAGGVGTSTWVRVMALTTSVPVQDGGVYRADQPGRPVDILVTSNTAASCARLGPALRCCPRPPVLVVMHTASGELAVSRSFLRQAEPYVTVRFDIDHRRLWLQAIEAPGPRLPTRADDIHDALAGLAPALTAMYAAPRSGPSAQSHGTGPTSAPYSPGQRHVIHTRVQPQPWRPATPGSEEVTRRR